MQKILEKVKTCSVPLSRPQDFHDILATLDTTLDTTATVCKPAVSIFDKLEELYREECVKELQNGNNVRQMTRCYVTVVVLGICLFVCAEC